MTPNIYIALKGSSRQILSIKSMLLLLSLDHKRINHKEVFGVWQSEEVFALFRYSTAQSKTTKEGFVLHARSITSITLNRVTGSLAKIIQSFWSIVPSGQCTSSHVCSSHGKIPKIWFLITTSSSIFTRFIPCATSYCQT